MIHHGKKKRISFDELPYSALVDDGFVGLGDKALLEYRRLKRLLSKCPTKLELLITNLVWSEGCCQKSTKAHLSKLSIKPDLSFIKTQGQYTLAIKMLSDFSEHNSGRDILNMALLDLIAKGTKPIAILQSALLGENTAAINSQILALADHACELMIPSFCGPIKLDSNMGQSGALAFLVLGIAQTENLISQRTIGTKNSLFYVGRAQKELKAQEIKALQELVLRASEKKMLNGLQNITKGGLAFAAMSLASQGLGLRIHIDEIRPEEDAREHLFLTEKPGSLLAVVEQKKNDDFIVLCKELGLSCVDVGGLSGDGILRVLEHGVELVHLPTNMIMENAPRMRLGYQSIIPLAKNTYEPILSLSLEAALVQLQRFQSGNLALASAFDHYVGLNTILGLGEADCALLHTSQMQDQLALNVLCDSRLILQNPKEATKRALFETLLKLKAMGSNPSFMGCTLFAAAPEREEVMTHIKHSIDSMVEWKDLCKVNIDSASVELGDEKENLALLPRLMIAAVGQKPAFLPQNRYGNAANGDLLVLIGDIPEHFTMAEEIFTKASASMLRPWEFEHLLPLQKALEHITTQGLCSSISIVGQGGLWAALLRIMDKAGLGINIEFGEEWLGSELLLNLFSEDRLRILISIKEHQLNKLKKQCANLVSLHEIGRVAGDFLLIRHRGQTYYESAREDVLAGRYVGHIAS